MNYWLVYLHQLNKLKAAKSASELSEAILFPNFANFEPAPPLSSIQRSNIPNISSHQIRRWLGEAHFKVHCEPSHPRDRLIK